MLISPRSVLEIDWQGALQIKKLFPNAILIFILSLILLIAAAASGYQSIDLLPTSTGVLYALAGTVAACGAVVTFAIGALTWKIGALIKLVQQSAGSFAVPAAFEVAPSTETSDEPY